MRKNEGAHLHNHIKNESSVNNTEHIFYPFLRNIFCRQKRAQPVGFTIIEVRVYMSRDF